MNILSSDLQRLKLCWHPCGFNIPRMRMLLLHITKDTVPWYFKGRVRNSFERRLIVELKKGTYSFSVSPLSPLSCFVVLRMSHRFLFFIFLNKALLLLIWLEYFIIVWSARFVCFEFTAAVDGQKKNVLSWGGVSVSRA